MELLHKGDCYEGTAVSDSLRTDQIHKRKFDADPHLQNILVKGEISNFKQHSSGHMYFTLKDEKARILAVMFAGNARSMKFRPENGMKVLVRGAISVYESSGQYQMYVQEMQPDGVGELYLAYEQLKEKLEKEGYFSSAYKKISLVIHVRLLLSHPLRVLQSEIF